MTLRFDEVRKSYGACRVLEGVSLAVTPGRVHALLGENGAGKSTLIKCAAGLVAPDGGAVSVDGAALRAGNAREAAARGVGVVHQHFMLVDTLTVAENVVLGNEPRAGFLGWRVDRDAARKTVRSLSERYGLRVDPDARVGSLAVGERQRVELLKALAGGARYVLLDEPTAVLSPTEVKPLLELVRGLAKGGAGVLFVSHKLDEVFAVSDELTVLRRGSVVRSGPAGEGDAESIARDLVGGEAPASGATYGRTTGSSPGKIGLRVEGLDAAGLRSMGLSVARGEVLGVAGVEGNGQRALAHAIAGLGPQGAGRVWVGESEVSSLDVRARRNAGLGYVPEDREGAGLCPDLSVEENLALGDPSFSWGSSSERAAKARALIERFDVRPADPSALVRALSGGNAQKVLVARELTRSLTALVIAQPTRGVDLGAAARIRRAIADARDAGAAVLLLSSELDELRALSDRMIVLRRGAVAAELTVPEATDEALGAHMTGAVHSAAAVPA